MASEEIKTGPQVVTEFLESLQGDPAIDGETLVALGELSKAQKLTKTRLLRILEEQRAKAIARESASAGPEASEP
jgi:hypothetical protein